MRYVLFLLALFPLAALAAPPVEVIDPWVRPAPAQTGAVGFMTLVSPQPDVLIRAQSDCCTAVEVHEHTMDGDIMQMRQVTEPLELPAGKPVTFESGGYHLMLIGLKKPLKDGATVPIELHFARSPTLTVPFDIRTYDAARH